MSGLPSRSLVNSIMAVFGLCFDSEFAKCEDSGVSRFGAVGITSLQPQTTANERVTATAVWSVLIVLSPRIDCDLAQSHASAHLN
jgi:hypothetical protein